MGVTLTVQGKNKGTIPHHWIGWAWPSKTDLASRRGSVFLSVSMLNEQPLFRITANHLSSRGSPRHDLYRISPLQRGSEYSKAFAVHGPKILL